MRCFSVVAELLVTFISALGRHKSRLAFTKANYTLSRTKFPYIGGLLSNAYWCIRWKMVVACWRRINVTFFVIAWPHILFSLAIKPCMFSKHKHQKTWSLRLKREGQLCDRPICDNSISALTGTWSHQRKNVWLLRLTKSRPTYSELQASAGIQVGWSAVLRCSGQTMVTCAPALLSTGWAKKVSLIIFAITLSTVSQFS